MDTNIKTWRNRVVEILRLLPTAAKIELAAALVLGKVHGRELQDALRSAASLGMPEATAKPPKETKNVPPEGEPIEFYYTSDNGNASMRRVIPTKIYQHTPKGKKPGWYLEAWCLENNNYRTYRLDHLNIGLAAATGAKS